MFERQRRKIRLLLTSTSSIGIASMWAGIYSKGATTIVVMTPNEFTRAEIICRRYLYSLLIKLVIAVQC